MCVCVFGSRSLHRHTGFSFCTQFGPTGNGTSCGSWNDTLVAQANAIFFREWFQRFPEFRKNDLFFTGESYAGEASAMRALSCLCCDMSI